MSRFYLSGNNSRGSEINAAGNSHGQYAHLRGWDSGILVRARTEDDIDVFDVFVTAGSRGYAPSHLIGTLRSGKWESVVN